MTENKLIGASFRSVKLSMLFTILQKIITFSLNQLLLMYTSPDIIGLSAVQLELLLSTLALSREGIRLTAIRESIDTIKKRQQLINLSYIPSMIIILIAVTIVTCSYFNLKIGSNNNEVNKIDERIVLLYCFGALFESLGEPFVNLFQNSLQMQPKLRAETIAIFARSCTTFVCIVYFQLGLLSFGFAQMVYGLIYLTVIIENIKRTPINGCILSITDFLPSTASNSITSGLVDRNVENNDNGILNSKMVSFAWTSTFSSLVKHVLTEADRITLSLTASSYDQGLFALANNYGSFLTRLLFLPLEDSSRMVFSKMTSEIRQNDDCGNDNNETIEDMANLFTFLFHSISTFILIFPTFGPNYVNLFVHLLFRSKWKSRDSVQTLGYYCFYLYSLGLNGISESFVHATAPAKKFFRINFGLLISTIVYIAIAIPLIKRMGTSGIIIAGSASMIVRTSSSLLYVKSCFDTKSVANSLSLSSYDPSKSKINFNILALFPHFAIIIVALISYIATKISSQIHEVSELRLKDHILHITNGIISFIAYAIIVFIYTKNDIIKLFKLIIGKNNQEKLKVT